MNNKIRISFKKKEDLEYIDHEILNNILVLKFAEDTFIGPGKNVIRLPIKLECFVGGSDLCGMLVLRGSFYKLSETSRFSISLENRNPIRGTYDYLMIVIKATGTGGKLVEKGTKFAAIKFMSTRYYELFKDNKNEGLRSIEPELEFYVEGEFKPHSQEQLLSNGFEIIKDENYKPGARFYEMNYISIAENRLDSDGNELDEPLYDETTEEFPK